MTTKFRKGVFISYSHKDQRWLDELLPFLKPYTRNEKISVWSDKNIAPGSDWAEEIKNSIDTCRVAILLVTPNFIASDYITEKELPIILRKQSEKELIIFWIAVSHAAYKTTDFHNIQSANNPTKPLDSLTPSERNKVFVEIADKISNAININAIGNVLKIIDDFVPQQKAFIDNVEFDNEPKNYSIQAKQENDIIQLTTPQNYVVETITGEDLDKLDRNSMILINSYENTMKDLFERWVELRPKSYSRDPIIREDSRQEMGNIRQDLCLQLNEILNYLQSMHKNLDDHYNHVRHICTQ
jgi:hypothetical protein